MSSQIGTTIDDGERFAESAPPAMLPDVAMLAEEIDQLRDCLEQLLEIVSGQPDHTDDIALLMERMAFYERRMQRAEDGLADITWTLRRQPGGI